MTSLPSFEHINGLKNLGNTCFLNAIIQALASCPDFVRYLQKLKDKLDLESSSSLGSKRRVYLVHSLFQCLLDVRQQRSASSNAKDILSILIAKNELFASLDQQDAEELFQTLISMLADEAKVMASKSKFSLKSLGSLQGDNPKCITASPLEGILGSQLVCEICHTLRPMRHQPFSDLSLSIPTAKRGHRSASAINAGLRGGWRGMQTVDRAFRPRGSSEDISLDDCLDQFLRGEIISDVECPACTATSTATKVGRKVAGMQAMRVVPAPIAAELVASKQALSYLQRCVMLGATDSIVMDLDNASVEQRPQLAYDKQYTKAAVAPTIASLYNTRMLDSSLPIFPLDVADAPPSDLGVEAHLIERMRTTVRKSLYLTRLPKVLCFHLQRRVYNSLTGRMCKLVQHIAFDLTMNFGDIVDTTGSATRSVAHSPLYPSTEHGESVRGAVDSVDSVDSIDVEPNQNCASASISIAEKFRRSTESSAGVPGIYDLRSIIVHSGSADGGHYTTVCKVGNRWFHTSDERVLQISEEAVMQSQAYMLFYCARPCG